MTQRQLFTAYLFLVGLLTTIGIVFIYSASSIFALERLGSAPYFMYKQLGGTAVGIVALVLLAQLPLRFFRAIAPWFFLGTLFLTSLTLIPNFMVKIHGSSRWLSLGFITFQPSELLKISFILYVAYFLEKKEFRLSSLIHGYLPFMLIVGITAGVLLAQPDFGQAVTLSITALALFFVIHPNLQHLLYTVAALIPVTVLLILMKPYRFQRVLTFLDPWKDPQGAGFQIIQSLIAIGSGHITGVGIAQSKQKFFYLPMQHTDFIFSIIAEETGFLGATTVIVLYGLLLYLGIKLAWRLKSTFALATVLGFAILIGLQAAINLMVATGLMPTKGIGLPFMSYGKSALIANFCMVGIMIACAKDDQELFFT